MAQNSDQAEVTAAVLARAKAAREAVSAVAAAATPVLFVVTGAAHAAEEGEGGGLRREVREMQDLESEISPIEAAKLNVTVAYSIASLYYMLLRAKGVSQQSHPIRSELDRVRAHVERIKKAEAGDAAAPSTASGPSASAASSVSGGGARGHPERTFVNTTVIKRTIGHELGIRTGVAQANHRDHDPATKANKKQKK